MKKWTNIQNANRQIDGRTYSYSGRQEYKQTAMSGQTYRVTGSKTDGKYERQKDRLNP